MIEHLTDSTLVQYATPMRPAKLANSLNHIAEVITASPWAKHALAEITQLIKEYDSQQEFFQHLTVFENDEGKVVTTIQKQLGHPFLLVHHQINLKK